MTQSLWYTLRDEVKSSLSCIDYINQHSNRSVQHEGQSILAPSFIRPDSDSKSFGVWSDSCFDFVTNTSYDIIDLCALDQFNGNTTQALEHLAGRKLPQKHSDSLHSVLPDQLQKLQDRVNYWHSQLLIHQPAVNYLASRHISLDTAKKLKLGYSPNKNRLVIPYLWNHGSHPAVYFVGRDLSGNSSLRYQFPSNNDKDFSEVLDHIPYGIHSARPGVFVQDTVTDPDSGQIVKLDTHNIRYDYLCITEGTFDVISFLDDGWAAMSGKKNSAHMKEFISICRQYRDCGQKIFLCFDNDNAGQNFQRDLANTLLKNRIPFVCAKLPKEFKDVSDYYAAGGSLETLVRNAQRGIEYLAEFCSSNDDLQELFSCTARFFHKDAMQLVYLRDKAVSLADTQTETVEDINGQVIANEVLKPRFDKFTVRELYKQACRPLMDGDIAHMVMDTKNIKYDITGSFYEYHSGVWKAIHKTIIDRYIIDAMGEKINSGKIDSVRRFMQSFLAGSWAFNTKPVFVFENGTLHLDEPFETVHTEKRKKPVLDENGQTVTDPKLANSHTIMDHTLYEEYEEVIHTPLPNKELPGMPANFHKHSPDDMCTYKVSYSYVPDAVNHELEKALDVWFEGDEEKKRLARQQAGYVLFASCCLQKFFYLIGDGANGKSTFLHIITAIFGSDHGSSLSAERMGSNFDIMLMKNSLYNMSYDTASDLTGCEETIKAITSGDPVVGSYKGVDAETFRTRSKLFIAANKHFSANDISRGLLRRICFLGFNKIFREDEADPYIEDKIMQDLPGLFNWAYQGYLDLKASGQFCETKEQQTLMEEFKEQLSGTLCFFREFMQTWDGQRILDDKAVYKHYREWAHQNGEKTVSKKNLITDLRQVLRVEESDITAIRDNETNCWQFVFPEKHSRINDNPSGGSEHADHSAQAEAVSQENGTSQGSSPLPQEEGQVDRTSDSGQDSRQITIDYYHDLDVKNGTFVHKYCEDDGYTPPIPEKELVALCVEPKKSFHYPQIVRDLKLSDEQIRSTARLGLARIIDEFIAETYSGIKAEEIDFDPKTFSRERVNARNQTHA